MDETEMPFPHPGRSETNIIHPRDIMRATPWTPMQKQKQIAWRRSDDVESNSWMALLLPSTCGHRQIDVPQHKASYIQTLFNMKKPSRDTGEEKL